MQQLLAEVRAIFATLPEAAPFLADWPEGGTRDVAPSPLPVCAVLQELSPCPETAPVWKALRAAAPGLSWRQTYGVDDFGEEFLRGYGWSEFIGLRGPVPSTRIACGVLLLGPGVTYPAHAHAAEELYLPIAGAAEWMRGQGGFAPGILGRGIHHAPWMPHAMRTGPDGVAALYLWRGGDLAAKSVILPH